MSEELWRKFNRRSVARRSVDEVLGIAKGIVLDGVVAQEEAEGLRAFLMANPDCANTWPWYALLERLNASLEDGRLSSDEESELLDTLVRLAGGNALVHEGVEPATQLPIDRPRPPIEFEGRTFCFTGVFATGTRKHCCQLTAQRGAEVQDSVTTDLDYLVIGAIATRDWRHSSYGNKILKAVDYKAKGRDIAIIAEHHWASVVETLEA